MNIPQELHYTKTHEWARLEQGQATVGITEHAQHEISDIVFIELPKVGSELEQGKVACVVESVKAAFDIYTPLSGVVAEINTAIPGDPSLANQDPHGKGWLFKISVSKLSEVNTLLTASQYEEFIQAAKA